MGDIDYTRFFIIISYAYNYENPRNRYDNIYYINKIFASDLNKSYMELSRYLNREQKTILKRSQVAWIKDRDANCSSKERGAVYVNCNTEQTIERNAWLRKWIREWKMANCQTNNLR